MSFIKCSSCGAINIKFNQKCHYCGKTMWTGDRIITTDNTALPEPPKEIYYD